MRAGEDTRPYGESGICRGRTLAGPSMYAARPGGRALHPSTNRHLLGKARRGSGTAEPGIFAHPGPSGPGGIAEVTQILRAGNFAQPYRYASPVMGVLGGGRHGGGRLCRTADCARPLASFGSFSTRKRNSPRRAKPCKTARRGRGPGQPLLPLRGNSPSRALRTKLHRPLIRPFGPPSPQGEGLKGNAAKFPYKKDAPPSEDRGAPKQIILRPTGAPGRR